MNYIDTAILVIIVLSMLIGWYRGFISTSISLVAYFGSLTFARHFYDRFLNIFYGNDVLMSTLLNYTEGSFVVSDVELAHRSITEIPLDTIRSAIAEVNVPFPLADLVLNNIEKQVYADIGMRTITDYVNHTIVNFSLHMLCIVLTFFVAFIVLSLINELAGYVVRYPALRIADGPVGALIGFVRGVFFAFFVFAFLPIVIAILPLDFLHEMVRTSQFAQFFYYQNILFDTVRALMTGG